MPIKFRCEYCRQLMGIAETKAGSLVDCPTCGRTLRVPNRNGTVDPPPKPSVNLADDGLRRALEELAQLGQAAGSGAQSAVENSISLILPPVAPPSSREKVPEPNLAAVVGHSAPNPLVNSIALEPLPAMKVVDPPAPQRAAVASLSVNSATISDGSHDQVLASIGGAISPGRPVKSDLPVSPASHGVPIGWVIAAMALSLVAGVVGGFGFGTYLATTSRAAPSATNLEPAPAAARSLIKGRLTYRNAQKQLQPDAGATVLILPVKREDAAKLSVGGLRPNDNAESRLAAAKRLEGQGGRLAQADDDGNFQIDVPDEGEYTIIGLSHFQGRPADDTGSADSLTTLEELFERPEQLIGKRAFQVASIKHAGTGTVIWDQTFGDEQ